MSISKRRQEAQRKRDKRAADRAAGWRTVTVRVAAEHADAVREFAADLPAPATPALDDLRADFEKLFSNGGADQ